MGEDLEKFTEKYPTYIEALDMLKQKDQRIAELEEERRQLIADNDFLKSERDNLDRTLQEASDRIAELEEENEELKSNLIKECKEHQDFCKEAKARVDELKEENAKLQEQLKNAIVPNVKVGDECYIIRSKSNNKGDWIDFVEKVKYRGIKFDTTLGLVTHIFTTEAEAQKYLEDKNVKN